MSLIWMLLGSMSSAFVLGMLAGVLLMIKQDRKFAKLSKEKDDQ